MLYLQPLLLKPLVGAAAFATVSAAAALRRSAQTMAQSITPIDVGELTDRVELIAGNGQCFVGAAEQLDSDFFAVDHQREFPVQAMAAVCQTPNAAAGCRTVLLPNSYAVRYRGKFCAHMSIEWVLTSRQ